MRLPRQLLCPYKSSTVHKYWKCHNEEYLLSTALAKNMYSKFLSYALRHENVSDNVSLHAFCYMDNHVHTVMSYKNGVKHLSKVMAITHTMFGQNLNKILKRKGKVGIERPKTPLIENSDNIQMKIHMYVEANPLRAKIVNNLKDLAEYEFSSYGFYANGYKSKLTKDLEPPEWYQRLGSNSFDRQKKYRQLFEIYLNKYGWFSSKDSKTNKLKDKGSSSFLFKRRVYFKAVMNIKRQDYSLSPLDVLKIYRRKKKIIKIE